MKIICIGQNYTKHIKELNSAIPTVPVFFMKPDTALITDNKPFYYPDFSKDLHYEVELVIKISKNGKNIAVDFAHSYYNEIGIGIDFTARDLQNKCKDKGLPWEIAKAFDGSAPIGNFISKTELKENSINFSLKVNDKQVQSGNSNDMIFSFNKIISYVSSFISLRQGDLIYTGTPEGVGPVKAGDKLEAFLNGKKMLEFEVK